MAKNETARLRPAQITEDKDALANLAQIAGYTPADPQYAVTNGTAAATGYRNENDEDNSGNESTNEITFQLYPNPASDLVTINFFDKNNLQATFELFDLTGRLILEKNIYSINGEQEVQLHDLTSGVYLYKVKTDSESLVQGKIVIVK